MDLQALALQKIALRCRTDLYFLCKEVLNYDLMVPHVHQELCNYTTSILPGHPGVEKIEGFSPSKNFLLLLMPRGTFKSSIVTIGLSLQYVLNEPNARILIDSETFSKSKAFLREIIDHLMSNPKYREIFRAIHGMYPFEKKSKAKLWTDSELILPCRTRPLKEPTISCAGIDVTKTGMHYDLIIMDDLHSEKNVTNRDQIDQVIQHYKLGLALLDPGKPLIMVGCLTADSKVLMADGTYLAINKVPVGSKVWSWEEKSQKLIIKTVEAMIPQGKAIVYEVKTKRHALKATGNHPFLTISGWKKAEELTKDDWLLTTKKINTDYRKRLPDGKFMDNDFAWLFGILVGDGWAGKDDKRGYVAVAKGIDEDLNNKILIELEKRFGRKPYETKHGFYRLDSIVAQRLLTNLGMTGGAKGKRIPDWLFKSRSSIKRAFLRGLIDADGYKNQRGYGYRVELANYGLIEDIRLLALTSGVRPTAISSRTRLIQPPNSKEPVLSITHSIGLTFQSRTENHTVFKKAWLLGEQGIRIDRVELVTRLDAEQEVFDLTVSDTHNFIADGMVVHNTRWDFADTYQYIIDHQSDRFNIYIKGAYNEDESLLFPERLNEEFLNAQKQSLNAYLFSCQYLNEPVSDETAVFKRDKILYKTLEEIKGRPINWYLSVDPSYEGAYSDYAALVLAGMDFQRDIYVRYITRKKMTYGDIIQEIFRIYTDKQFQDTKIQRIYLETIATQKSIGVELGNEQRRRNTWLPVEEIRSQSTSKEERIRLLAPFYEFGHIFHVRECPELSELEYELLHFPRGQHDDMIDALATIVERASPPNAKHFKSDDEPKRRIMSIKPRSAITGY